MKLLFVLVALLGITQVTQALFPVLALAAFKGAALGYLAGRAGRRGGGFGRGYGRGRGFGRGYGRGRGGYGRRRYGRDLSAVSEPQSEPEAQAEAQYQAHEVQVEALQMDAYFAAIRMGDEDGCGLRLVCELRTLDPAMLGEEESMMLALFGDDVPSSGRLDSPKRPYDEASELGRRAGSAEVCAQTYRTCQYDSETLIEALHTSPEM